MPSNYHPTKKAPAKKAPAKKVSGPRIVAAVDSASGHKTKPKSRR